MRKIILLLIMLILSILFLSSIEAIDDKKPSVKVIYQRDRDTINPGEIVKFDVYFPGDGKITLCRGTLYYERKNFDTINYTTYNIPVESLDLNASVWSFLVNNEIFGQSENADPWWPTLAEMGGTVEGTSKPVSPLVIWFDTKSDIIPGSHNIILLLSYTDGNEWYTYEKNLEFHVNDFFEQNPFLIIIIYPIVLIVFGGLLNEIRHRRKIKKEQEK